MKRWTKIKRRRSDRSIKSSYEKQTKRQKKNGKNAQSKSKKLNNLLEQVLQNKKKLQNIPNLNSNEDLKLMIKCKLKFVILEMDVGIIIIFQVKFKPDNIGALKQLLE